MPNLENYVCLKKIKFIKNAAHEQNKTPPRLRGRFVTPKVQMSNTFIEDCKKIVALKHI